MDIKKYKQYLRPELHQMLDDIVQSAGTVVNKLPPLNTTAENARFLVKQTDGSYREHIKVNGKYQNLNGAGTPGTNGENGTDGADGANAYVYIAYAADASGAGFSTAPGTGLNYIAVLNSCIQITDLQASDFAGLWSQYTGGGNGITFNSGTTVQMNAYALTLTGILAGSVHFFTTDQDSDYTWNGTKFV
jgi:hypothetical protein